MKPRNFKPKLINTEFEKVRNLPGNTFRERRKQALMKVTKGVQNAGRIVAPIDFNPHMPKISQVFKKHHRTMLINAPHLGEMFKFAPMAAYRQPPNLRRLICKSKLHPISNGKKLVRGAHKNAAGWKKCGHNCKICPYTLNNTHTIKGLA